MATKRALSHLQAITEMTEQSDAQIRNLAATLRQTVVQMDAVLNDADREVDEILTEETTGDEAEFVLQDSPILEGSLQVYVNDGAAPKNAFVLDGKAIRPVKSVPKGKTVRAAYTVAGLKTQTAALMRELDDVDSASFVAWRTKALRVIEWIEKDY